ncbi:hypothetical protein ACTFIU_008530 [Dictyostelium citrinum]
MGNNPTRINTNFNQIVKNKENDYNEILFISIWRNKYIKNHIFHFIKLFNNNDHFKMICNYTRDLMSFKYSEYLKSINIKVNNYDNYNNNKNNNAHEEFEMIFKNLPSLLEHIETNHFTFPSNELLLIYPNIKSIKFNFHSNPISLFFDHLINVFPNLVRIEFSNGLDYNGELLNNLISLESLTFSNTFNEEINFLPPNLKSLKFGNVFNKTIDLLMIKKLKKLEFGGLYNISWNYSSNVELELESLIFGMSFKAIISNNVMKKCLVNLTHLEFGSSFSRSLQVLPNKLQSIVVNNVLSKSAIKCCEDSLTSITMNIYFNPVATDCLKYAKNLKTLSLKSGFLFKEIGIEKKLKLPKSITSLDLRYCKYNQFDDNFSNELPNLKTLYLFNHCDVNSIFNFTPKILPSSLVDIRCIISNHSTFNNLLIYPTSPLPISRIKFLDFQFIDNQISTSNKINSIKLSYDHIKSISFNSLSIMIQLIPLINIETLSFTFYGVESLISILYHLKINNIEKTGILKNLILQYGGFNIFDRFEQLEKVKIDFNNFLPTSIVSLFLINSFHNLATFGSEHEQIQLEVQILDKLWNPIISHKNLKTVYCLNTSVGLINYFIEKDYYHILKIINIEYLNNLNI